MQNSLAALAQRCLTSAYDGSLDFPGIVRVLHDAGFDGYDVDYRRGRATYFLPDGQVLELHLPGGPAQVAAEFRKDLVAESVRRAQTKAPGYSYAGFCEEVQRAGCAGYMVSLLGRRVVYFGRTAQTHVEEFPQ